MGKNGSPLESSRKASRPVETRKISYTSYNALAGKVEVKSVSEAMHDYIRVEFQHIEPKKKQ